jgi:hypothetical protein
MSWFWRRTGALDFEDERRFDACVVLVRVVYAAVFFMLFQAVWERRMEAWPVPPENPHALWPTFWFASFEWDQVATFVPLVTLLSALAAVLWPHRLLPRLLVFVGVLTFTAAHFTNKSKIDHNFHTLLAALFVFVFLPRVVAGAADEERRRASYCEVFWGAQALVLLTYTLAGCCKLMGVGIALWLGELTAFHSDAMGLHIAQTWGRAQDTLLGHALARNPTLGQLGYVAAIYFEVTAVVAAFRPRLHLVWGAALVLLHVGVVLTMGILFMESSLVLLVLLCLSPFAPREAKGLATLAEFPGLRGLGRIRATLPNRTS